MIVTYGKGEDEEEILDFKNGEELVKQACREQKSETSEGHDDCQAAFKTLLRCMVTGLK